MHLNRDMSAERLIAEMDRAGVKAMVLMARYYGGANGGQGSDEQALAYAEKYPGRFIPFIAGQRGDLSTEYVWSNPTADVYLGEAGEKARSGRFHGLGEFIMYHHAYQLPKWGQTGGAEDVVIPVDSGLMRGIANIGARYDIPVLIHLEGEPEKVAAMTRLLEARPKTKFIWAHSCGRMSAERIRGMLRRFANLMCDLGGMTRAKRGGHGTYWPRRTPWIQPIENGFGSLYPEMRQLYQDFPDRFMIGTDAAHTPALQLYQWRVKIFRQLLSQLSEGTARRLAYQNAEELFGLE